MALVTYGDLTFDLQRKAIKNLHINVLPPEGHVRVSAPLNLSDTAIRIAVVRRLLWIRQQQAAFASQARQSERQLCSGESYYLWGRAYRLEVVPSSNVVSVKLQGGWIKLQAPLTYEAPRRELALQAWYRRLLQQRLPALLAKWEARLQVHAEFVGIKRMKTKWGSCNPDTKRIWLNLELVKKPPECLEFIVVHELVHLLERGHNSRFMALMDLHLPNWREQRTKLNQMPLAYNEWIY
ncbi:MAG: M48 family metallopeptidase [Shewanella sp.]|uniref:M48 family metallopeptidase n=1 Tax=Shewanella sp. TaxID=50422 RepID=UPI003F3D20C9